MNARDQYSLMAHKRVLVTGATDGIGRVTALELARRGAQVLGVGRDGARCSATAAAIRSASGNPEVEFLVCDLSSQAAVRALAEQVRSRWERLDVLVNNAGALFPERRESVDGVELTWALNHLAYFLLTALLEEPLCAAPAGRVVSVASGAHRGAKLDLDDPEGRRSYRPWRAYCRSKLANLLFAFELARRLEGTRVTSNALHPGVVATSFFRNRLFTGLKRALVGLVSLTPEKGARTSLHLACAPELQGSSGLYFVRERPARPSRAALDEDVARRLWRLSAERCGLA